MSEEPQTAQSLISKAARTSVLNALWLGPLNMYFWFSSGRFDQPYYTNMARADGVHIDEVISYILIAEMLLLILSLFAVSALFARVGTEWNFFTSVIFLACATVLWNGLGILFGL